VILQMMSNLLSANKRYLIANSEPQEKFCHSLSVYQECRERQYLSDWALDLTFLQGQAYDGAGAMAGCSRRVATCIQDKYPKAL